MRSKWTLGPILTLYRTLPRPSDAVAVHCPRPCFPTPACGSGRATPARSFPGEATFRKLGESRPSGKRPRRPTALGQHSITEAPPVCCPP